MNLNKRRIGAYLKGAGKPGEDHSAGESDTQKRGEVPGLLMGKGSAAHPEAPAGNSGKQEKTTGGGDSGGTPEKSGSSLIRTTRSPAGAVVPKSGVSGKADKPGRKEIAKFLMLIGKDEAASILQHLPPDEVEALAREIASIPSIHPEEAKAILERFKGLVRTNVSAHGGVETARRILVNAFGENVGGQMLRQALPQDQEPFFAFLQDMEAGQVVTLLRGESVAVKSIVLAHMVPAAAAGVLKAIPRDEQKDLILRLGRMQKVEREVLIKIEEALKERIRSQGRVVSEEVDGSENLAAIMRHLDPDLEQKLIHVLEQEAPDVAETIKERLFTIDTLLLIDDRDLQKVLTTLENKAIALILKGKNDAIRRKILGNVSENRAQLVSEEYQNLGPQPKREVDQATREFIAHLRKLEQDGVIVVRRDDEEYI